MSNANEISTQILYMICDVEDYELVQSELAELRPHHNETEWEEVGDLIREWLLEQFNEGGRFHGPNPNFFEINNVLDFTMQIYEFAGERALVKKYTNQFELANRYSDQGGLSRKFELYESLVSESYPLINKREVKDKMHYYFTRSLNRLAQLTTYWNGEEESIPLWTRLAEHANGSDDAERMSILQVIQSEAPWFVSANAELFERGPASEKQRHFIESLGGEVTDELTKADAGQLLRDLMKKNEEE